jgi:CBS domain-containing protein
MLGIRLSDPVRTLVGDPVATIGPTATLREAAETMSSDGVGLLVVVDTRGVLGVLSERDVVNAVAEGADLDDERVRARLADDVVTIDEGATISDAAATMASAEIRHLGVTRQGDIYGVVSVRDVVNVLLEGATE